MSGGYKGLAKTVSRFTGRASTFALALGVIGVWIVTGPVFNFSDTWQLVINTGTTIITFLMVFLIQNTQNRDNGAIHAKLDELLRAIDAADNEYIGIEHLTDEELQKILRKVEQNAHHLHEEKGRRAAKGEKAAGRSSPRRAKTPAV